MGRTQWSSCPHDKHKDHRSRDNRKKVAELIIFTRLTATPGEQWEDGMLRDLSLDYFPNFFNIFTSRCVADLKENY